MKTRRLFTAAVLSLFIAWVAAGAAEAQPRSIKGEVTDVATGDPLPGATVTIEGTTLSATTASDGAFTIPDAPAGALTVQLRAPGYRGATVSVPENQSDVRVGLTRELAEEIVVTGRVSRTERRNLGVSIATVKSEDLTETPAQTVDTALQGKVTGANIQRNDGAPGGGVQVRLRGVSSINASAEPLFVVDGMIVSNVSVPSGIFNVTKSNLGGNHSIMQDSVVNRMADFNAEDIESIEVLKGAAAAAIYGAKASNGVVIINTKRGQVGPPRVDVTQRFGVSMLSNEIGARNFGSLNAVIDQFCPPDKTTGQRSATCVANQTAYYGPGTVYNHDKELAGRHDLGTETIVGVSGGSKDFRYFVSGAVKNDPGIIDNTGYQKQAVRLNLGKDLGDQITVNFYSNLIHSDAKRGITNNDNTNTSNWIVLSGTPSYVNLNPQGGTYPTNPYSPNLNNPLQTVALMNNSEGVWRFTSSADSTFRLYDTEEQRLRFIVTGGVDRLQQENDLLFPPELFWQQTSPLHGASGYASTTGLNLNLGLNLVHDWRPASGLFGAISSGGFQYESSDLRTYRLFSQNLNAGQPNIDAGTQSSITENRERVHDRGAYLQEEVLLLERRLALTAALRGETSSSNGDPNKIYFYPKASASYRFQNLLSDLDELKVRAAYGETGNHPLYGARFTALQVNTNIQGNPGIGVNFICSPAAPGNGACAGDPNIKPERAREFEVGTDVTAFGGAATLELNLYQRTIVDLLLQHAVPASSGWTAEWSNGGVLRNRGIEIALSVRPTLPSELRLESTLGFSRNVSSVRSLPGGAFVTGGFGASLGVYRIEQGASATQIVGDVGLLPDGTCCVLKKIGDAEPDFLVHFSNRLVWRNFSLYFLLDWQKGSNIINLTRLLYDANANSADWNTTGQARFNHWLASYADAYVESASFLKLREITLAYEVPSAFAGSLWSAIKKIRFSVSARNLFTITPYSSWDPEVSNFANQPIYRNIEVTPYPSSRSFWTSVDMSFY